MRKIKVLIVPLLSLLLLSGCSSPVEEVAGNLEEVSLSEEELIDQRLVIGVANVKEPGSGLFDEPDGVTIGRIPPGDYSVVKMESNWALIYLPTDDSTYGWIPLTSADVRILD